MMPMALLREGERAEIVARHTGDDGGGPGACRHREQLERIGIRPGSRVEMLANSGHGPLLLRLDETRIALGRGIATRIYVRRDEK